MQHLLVDHQRSLLQDGALHWNSPSSDHTLVVHKAVVVGSIPSCADRNQDSCFLPVSTAVVLCKSQIGGLWAGEESAIKPNSNLTLREALLMDIMPVWHIPFAAPPSRSTVKQHLAFGDDW